MRVLAFALCLLAAVPAAAQPTVRQPLPGTPAVLRGRVATYSTAIEVDAADDPTLTLSYARSELLRADESSLSVLVDGRPVRTVRVGGPTGRMQVALGALDAGFHRVDVRARLVVGDDRCVEDRLEEAWLRLDDDSSVSWTRAVAGEGRATVAGTLAGWRAEDVRVDAARVPAEERVRLAVEADHLLRAHGAAPTGEGDAPALGLRVDPAGFESGFARSRILLEGAGVALEAASAEDLRRTLLALREASRWSACDETECAFGPLVAPARQEPEAAEQTSRVLTLADIGMARGWQAQGAGEHVLRFRWVRPARWTLREWPEVRLPLRVSREVLDPNRSLATLHVNGRPLAQWRLEDAEGMLALRIPRELWDEEEWAFEVRVSLVAAEAHRCAARGAGPWAIISEEASLTVPREEPRYAGLASLARHDRAPTLRGVDGLSTRFVPSLAAVLYELRAPDDEGLGLAENDACPAPCVEVDVVPPSQDFEGVALATHRDEVGWWLPELGPELPLGVARGALLVADGCEPDCARLRVALPEVDAPTVAPPPSLRQLAGPRAVSTGERWFELQTAQAPQQTVRVEARAASPDMARRESEQERVLGLVDLGWGMAVALVLFAGALWLWRSRKVEGDQLA